MNSIKLEIIEDDAAKAPRLSRVLPAVLYNIVTERSYIEFCDKIDALLAIAAVDWKCRANRLAWSNYGVFFWTLWFVGFFMMNTRYLFDDDSGNTPPKLYYILLLSSFAVCVGYFVVIRIWMVQPTGAPPAAETMQEIRAECEAMTKRTPHASFHVVLSPLATALRGHSFARNTISCIEVSVSVDGFELAKTNNGVRSTEAHNNSEIKTSDAPRSAIHATSVVSNDYQQLHIV